MQDVENSLEVDEHIDDTVTVSKDYGMSLVCELAEQLYVQPHESILNTLGEEHPLTQLENLFR